MAKKSETLTQHNKAQRDLIELKKMQAGELEVGPKPSEQAIVPKTFKEKKDNFFYHYKYVVIVGVFLAVVASILIYDIIKRPNYDSKVIVFSYDTAYSSYNEKIADYFEQFYSDVNGNGKVEIAAIDCSINPDEASELQDNKLTQLHAMMAVDNDAIIYLLDEESIKHFDNLDKPLFDKDGMVLLGDDFYDFIKIEGMKAPEKKVYAAVRAVDGTAIEGQNKNAYDEAVKVLQKIKSQAGE